MKTDLFPVPWEVEEPQEPLPTVEVTESVDSPPTAPPRAVPWPRVAAGVGVLLLLGAMLWLVRPSPCSTRRDLIDTLRHLLNQGRPSLVVGLADVALTTTGPGEPLCQDAKLAVVLLRSVAARAEVFSIHGYDDLQAGRLAFERWHEAEAKDEAYGLPREQRPPAMATFKDAVDRGLWELAQAAFLTAWDEGAVGPSDWQAVSTYFAASRNYAGALLRSGDKEQQGRGLAILRTACEISRAYKLGRGEACQDLMSLVGPDQDAWPPPLLNDPVLSALWSS